MTRERGAIFYDSLGKRVAIIIDATEISDAFREILLFNEASACSVDLSSYAAIFLHSTCVCMYMSLFSIESAVQHRCRLHVLQ